MKLLQSKIINISESIKRLTGTVQYNDGFEEDYWFEFPSYIDISDTGNPWVALLLPLAITLGEDLHISLPIDPKLMDASEDLVKIWKCWYPHLSEITVYAEKGTSIIAAQPNEAATFFSAGVDSFFTAYRRPRAKTMILVQGFDMPLSKKDAFKAHCKRITNIAHNMGADIIPVVANMRETRWKNAHWEALAYGPALASVALLFEQKFNEVFIPASCDYANAAPLGSHPLTDPLFTTTRTNIIHEGSGFTRYEKIKYISQYALALNELHVCYRGQDSLGQDETNCCRCEKCQRTMIALDLLGKLDDSHLFDKRKFSVADIHKIYVPNKLEQSFYIEMRDAAHTKGRNDIVREINKLLQRSKRLNFIALFNKTPFIWRISHNIINKALGYR